MAMKGSICRPPQSSVNEEDGLPRKRQRTDEVRPSRMPLNTSASKQHRQARGGRDNNQKRTSFQRSRGTGSYQPRVGQQQQDSDDTFANGDSDSPTEQQQDMVGAKKAPSKPNHKTKRERKDNPSTRIRSLRNQLAAGYLPPPIQAEKERELASLIYAQKKAKLRTEAKRNLERYHFIRFMERQKAQRILKKLQKLKKAGLSKDEHGADIDERIQETQTDLNYAVYAPLAEKYIGVFNTDITQKQKQQKVDDTSNQNKLENLVETETETNAEPKPNTRSEEDPQKDLDSSTHENLQDAAGKHTKIGKPPTWWEVQKAMSLETEDQQKSALEKLRDRVGDIVSTTTTTTTTTAAAAQATASSSKTKKRKLDQGDDNAKESEGHFQSKRNVGAIRGNNDNDNDNDNDHDNNGEDDDDEDDDDMSDGDGGFFEKR